MELVDSPRPLTEPAAAARHAFLLTQLAAAPDRRLRLGDVNKRLATKAAKNLELTKEAAAKDWAALAEGGYVRIEKVGRSVWYAMTDAGAAYLESLREFAPARWVRSGGTVHHPANEDVRQARTAYLLLQLLAAENQTLTAAEANRPNSQAKDLDLNAATVKHVRHELAGQGLLTVARDGRGERYTLTDAGRLRLGTLAFFDSFRFQLTGRTLNALLEAAREAAKQFGAPAPERSPAELPEVILGTFDTLRRERHAVTGLVPVHEVRAEVLAQFGPAAARHDVFDEAVLGLWRAKRVRLTPIADRGKATAQQLQDAIPGVGETLFYLEVARESAAV